MKSELGGRTQLYVPSVVRRGVAMEKDTAGFTVLEDVEATDAAAPLAHHRTCGSACSTCTPAAPAGLVPRQRKYLVGGLLVVLVGVVLLACLLHGWHDDGSGGGKGPAPADDGAEFAIMLDAGSSGTRVHVYSWPVGSPCSVRPDKHFPLPQSFPHTKLTSRCGTGICDAGPGPALPPLPDKEESHWGRTFLILMGVGVFV